MTAPNINLIEMRYTAIARGDGDILELDVHVVFGFEELPAVDDAGCDFEGNDVALQRKGLEG